MAETCDLFALSITAELRYAATLEHADLTDAPADNSWPLVRTIETLGQAELTSRVDPARTGESSRMTTPQSERTLTYAAYVTREDVRALETFLNT
ncbi:hypothetical protein ABZT45_35015 [Streptomyces sp. NPDC005356]|uniref:hypothetical protein n=1 Tax=Streptomyces sp. NPDC005356 TaxID=3157167 RepID=UPI0033B560CE